MFKILVVEDDRELNRSVCFFLRQNGYDASGAQNAQQAYEQLFQGKFDLIISDIMMPGTDGFEFLEAVRSVNQEIPIMFMTARDDFPSKQKSFRAGVDDYMVKPLDLDELLLRIGALMRRARIVNNKKLVIGSLKMDADAYSAYIGDEELLLTVREFNILYKLLSYPGKTFTRTQLMDEFWNAESASGPRTVDVYMAKIREKAAACKDFDIITIRGLGYKAVLK